MILSREERERPGALLEEVQEVVPLRMEGLHNFIWLFGVIGVIYVMGEYGSQISGSQDVQLLLQVLGMSLMAALSLLTTSREIHSSNRFAWHPIIEVAVIFIGVFITMIPALKFLEARGGELGLSEPWQFFWATGGLSSFLDNAPTYLTFTSLAVGVVNTLDPAASLEAEDLLGLVNHPTGHLLLKAISCGAVFMGANTYIGNGPNFMVKAIAEQNGVPMPHFFGYMLWSVAFLIPLFIVVTLVFFL
jgi:Na+/H+ antiporter NhaD/arsenite permease-like protein